MLVLTKPKIFYDSHELPPFKSILVPGASVYRSGQLSPVLEQRMQACVRLLNARDSSIAVLSGFSIPKGYNEVKAMADFAKKQGIPASRIVTDEKGTSTYRTVMNCKHKHCLGAIVIVSQGFHLPRALYMAQRFGIEAYGLASDGSQQTPGLRELSSRVKDFILILIFSMFNAKGFA